MTNTTAAKELILIELQAAGYILDAEVKRRRQTGISWRHIAHWILDETGRDISYQTLINWFPEYNKPAAELTKAAT